MLNLVRYIESIGRRRTHGSVLLYGKVVGFTSVSGCGLFGNIGMDGDGLFYVLDVYGAEFESLEDKKALSAVGFRDIVCLRGRLVCYAHVGLSMGDDVTVRGVVYASSEVAGLLGCYAFSGGNSRWSLKPLSLYRYNKDTVLDDVLRDYLYTVGREGIEGYDFGSGIDCGDIPVCDVGVCDEGVGLFREKSVPFNTDLYDIMLSDVERARDRGAAFALELGSGLKGVSEDYVGVLLEALRRNYFRGVSGSGYVRSGKDIVGVYLKSNYPKLDDDGYRELLYNFESFCDELLGGCAVDWSYDSAAVVARAIKSDLEYFYGGIVGVIFGFDSWQVRGVVQALNARGVSFSRVFNENPYALYFLGDFQKGYKVFDRIAMSLGVVVTSLVRKVRGVLVVLEYVRQATSGSVFTVDKLEKWCKNPLLGSVSDKVKREVECYFEGEYEELTGVVSAGVSLMDAVAVGSIILFGNGVSFTSTDLMDKELFCYKRLNEMACDEYALGGLDDYIMEYEGRLGFQLDEGQRRALSLLGRGAGVITGVAGGGKSTVVGCMRYALQKVRGEGLQVVYVAPTGKAAKRLEEVVGCEVRTIHSRFRMGVSGLAGIEDLRDTVVFCDEAGMLTTDLLYGMLSVMGSGCSLYLVGDIEQLPPIGHGLPFRDALEYLPFARLKSNKRALSGSSIIRNAVAICEGSDGPVLRELVVDDNFMLVECATDKIPSYVRAACERLLDGGGGKRLPVFEGVTPDDIQVISPVVSDKYVWSTGVLNESLREVFNASGGATISLKRGGVLGVGDRVINTRNAYDRYWYECVNGAYRPILFERGGVLNGDMGYIVDITSSVDIEFSGDEVFDRYRDDSIHDGHYIVVRYNASGMDYYVIYHALEWSGLFYGDDVDMLSLGYALTVHKMQGSAARFVVGVLGSDLRYSSFINRQLLYTLVTRGVEFVMLIGGVSRGSVLDDARRNGVVSRARTVMSYVCGG